MSCFKSVFIVTVFFLVVTACSPIQNPEFKSIDRLELSEETVDELILDLDVSVFNPNRFSIYVQDMSVDLYIDTLKIGNMSFSDSLLFLKNQNTVINSSLIVRKNMLNSYMNLTDSISVHVLGSMAVPYVSYYYFDFSYDSYIENFKSLFYSELIKDIDVRINEVKIKELTIKNTTLELSFILDNQSNMECEIKSLDVNVYKTSSYKDIIGSSSIQDSFIAHTDTLSQFVTNVKVDNMQMGSTLLLNTMSGKNSFFIIVNTIIAHNNIEAPIFLKSRVDYNPTTLEIELK